MLLDEKAMQLNIAHQDSDARTVLRKAITDQSFGKLAMVSSFGAESVVLLHMVSQIDAGLPVIFLDTEMLFPETLAYQQEVSGRLGLRDVRVISPDRAAVLQEDVDGLLHQADTDACCDLRKTRPLAAALQGFDGWITGRKRFQSGTRTRLPVFEKDGKRLKINPLADWSAQQLRSYIADLGLPAHPLVSQGYPSIGCMPCTTRVAANEDARAGRWRDSDKVECGIHFENGRAARRSA